MVEIEKPMGCDLRAGDTFEARKRLGMGRFIAEQVEQFGGVATVYYRSELGGMLNVIAFNEYEALNYLSRNA